MKTFVRVANNMEILGLIPDPRSEEEKALDYKHEELFSASPVEWKEKTEFRSFPIRNQDGSSMCVAFATAKCLGVNNLNEKGEYVTLSPRDIYTRRNTTGQGMWIQNAGDIVKTYGATLEALMPSENIGEVLANKSNDRTPESEKMALEYKAKGYVFIANTPTVMDDIAQMVDKGYTVLITTHFANEEWTDTPTIKVPKDKAPYYHAITVTDYFLKNGEKYLVIEDSWGQAYGNKGRRFLSETWVRSRFTGAMYFIDWKFEQVQKPRFTFNKVMLYGQKTADIVKLQDVLKFEGLMPTTQQSTGYYGEITRKGVLAFQRKYQVADEAELVALNGKRCGLKTLAVLNKYYS